MGAIETLTPAAVTHWIDGEPVPATSGRVGAVTNPATGEVIAEVGFASSEEVDLAVAAAKAAAHDWRSTPLSRRAEVLFNLRNLIAEHRAEFAAILSRENGKTMADALGEVARGLENVEFACGIPNLLKGGYTEQASRGVDVYQIRQPLGVVAGITPFNFPAMVPLWMLSNAIACGNTFVLKPSEKVPSASVLIAELLSRLAFPTVYSISSTAIRLPLTGSSNTPTSRRSASWDRRPSPNTFMRLPHATASACRRSAVRRIT